MEGREVEEEEEEDEEEEDKEEEEEDEEEEEEEERENWELEKVRTFSKEMGKGGMLETSKNICQNKGHTDVCLIASVTWPQPKAQP